MAGTITPARSHERQRNRLRPDTWDDIIGQVPAKRMMKRACDACFLQKRPLDHTLLVGPGGTGKSTFSHVIANDLGVDVYELEAPVDSETLLRLRTTMCDGDILKVEEIHQQAIMERRGRQAATQPEVFYAIMEDRTIPTATGILPYPEITVLGTTTDEGMLPDSFVMRFPLKPRLVAYTLEEAKRIATMNAERLDMQLEPGAAEIFARASRQLPREVNNLMRYAAILGAVDGRISERDALEVLVDTGVTRDGLTADMQAMLVQLYTKGRRETADGEVRYQASVTTIATLIGKSRDAKAVQLRVEPYLIERGFVQVLHGGRALTDAGVQRARQLLGGSA